MSRAVMALNQAASKAASGPKAAPRSCQQPARSSNCALLAKLRVGPVDDPLEREADRAADAVLAGATPHLGSLQAGLQRKCSACEHEEQQTLRRQADMEEEDEELQMKAEAGGPVAAGADTAAAADSSGGRPLSPALRSYFQPRFDHDLSGVRCAGGGRDQALRQAEVRVDAVSGGQPLSNEQRAFFEPRFGADFSRVRIHADGSADAAARAVGALAFTRGSDIVFRGDQYRPHSFAGRQLLAHELTHVVQQGAAPDIKHRSANESGETNIQSSEMHMGVAGHVVQRYPGDGMVPPGDCGWARYLLLRGSVETAKAVVSTLGACSAGDNCLTLAAKIAAITAEIAARVALDATCFRGGDTGHRQQVQDKINMMNRCYRFFSNSNCPPELIAAMAVVVERAREVIAAAAVVVAIALVVALIAAIIALAEVIAALAAAVAEAAALAAGAAAVIALLVLIKDELSPEDSSSA